MATHHAEIFHLPEWDSWALQHLDAEGNQIGELETAFHKRTLLDFVKGHLDDTPVKVFGANGRHLYTLNA